LLKVRNIRKFYLKKADFTIKYAERGIDYDSIYNFMEGWIAYTKNADTYNLRRKILVEFERTFANEISTKEVNRILPKRKNHPEITKTT
jgi:hypothetical protein